MKPCTYACMLLNSLKTEWLSQLIAGVETKITANSISDTSKLSSKELNVQITYIQHVNTVHYTSDCIEIGTPVTSDTFLYQQVNTFNLVCLTQWLKRKIRGGRMPQVTDWMEQQSSCASYGILMTATVMFQRLTGWMTNQ